MNSSPSAGKIAAYVGAFLLLVAVVAVGYESPRQASGKIVSDSQNSAASIAPSVVTDNEDNPDVDQVVATGVAADLAARANLPIASNVANMSVSLAAKSELAQTDATAITKPQIITPTEGDREVQTHVVVSGETIPDLAKKYGISENTIRWANDINGDALEPGRKLTILPISGVLYTAKSGDSPSDLAKEYRSDASRITTYNNLELTSIKSGQKIIIPNGVKPSEPAPQQVAASGNQSFGSSLGGSVLSNGMANISAGNRYAYGNCTYYVYERRAKLGKPVGSFWGNANTWASSARSAGFKVNGTPAAGAVLVDQAGYFGHVAIVERVLSNGDVYITEMNNYAYGGFNIVNDRTISAGQASAYQYIH